MFVWDFVTCNCSSVKLEVLILHSLSLLKFWSADIYSFCKYKKLEIAVWKKIDTWVCWFKKKPYASHVFLKHAL
jgi:hypothetical protein